MTIYRRCQPDLQPLCALMPPWLHLPEVVGAVMVLAASEWSIALVRGRPWGELCSWLCVVAVGLTGMGVLVIVMYTLSSVQHVVKSQYR